MLSRFSLVLIFFLSVVGGAQACSCERPPEDVKGDDAYLEWKFKNAKDVVRGRVTSLRVGDDTKFGGHPFVLATMKVDVTVKGDVGPGEITLITGFGLGDCGLAQGLLTTLGWSREVEFEVRTTKNESNWKDKPQMYWISICGYAQAATSSGFKLKTK